MTVPVQILGLFVMDPATGSSIVLLGEQNDTTHVLPIFIGPAEAQSIALATQGITLPRPGTHDLMVDLSTLLGATIASVTVTELVDSTFHAELELHTEAGSARLSCRPSDGIALAVRVGAPVHVDRGVFDDAAVEIEHEVDQPFAEEDIDEIVSEFERFLATAEPSDFTEAAESGEPAGDEPEGDEPDDDEA